MTGFTVLPSTRFEDVRLGDRITLYKNGVTVEGPVLRVDDDSDWIELGLGRFDSWDIDVTHDTYTLVRIERPDGSPILPDADGVYQRTAIPIMFGGPLIIRLNGDWVVDGARYDAREVQALFPLQRMVGGDL